MFPPLPPGGSLLTRAADFLPALQPGEQGRSRGAGSSGSPAHPRTNGCREGGRTHPLARPGRHVRTWAPGSTWSGSRRRASRHRRAARSSQLRCGEGKNKLQGLRRLRFSGLSGWRFVRLHPLGQSKSQGQPRGGEGKQTPPPRGGVHRDTERTSRGGGIPGASCGKSPPCLPRQNGLRLHSWCAKPDANC